MNYNLIAYAQDFSSFLLQQLGDEARKVKQIILFGSVARGEAGKESDVDLFVDVLDEKLEKNIQDIKERFLSSIKVTKYWALLGIRNEIVCTVGKLANWKPLERSIILNGVVLYGKYMGKPNLTPFFLFIVVPGKKRKENVSLWRMLYGYQQKVKKKVYRRSGLVIEYEGKKLGKSIFVLPAEHAQKMQSFLRAKKFTVQVIPFWRES